MSEDNRKSGFMVGTALALSLSLAACATHKTTTTVEPVHGDSTAVEQHEPGILPPPFNPPFANPVDPEKGKKKQGTGENYETSSPGLD